MDADALIAEQITYYRARAAEYDESLRQLGRYVSLGGAVAGSNPENEDEKEIRALVEALEQRRPFGHVLELACGTGWWTQYLAPRARGVAAVDVADEMLAINQARVRRPNVAYVRADIFSWRPTRRYDLVFFAFWLSHVPHDRFIAFWRLVRDSLARNGRVFFIDELENQQARKFERRIGADAVLRTLDDGRQFRAVKVFYEPRDLQAKLLHLGWDVDVQSAGPNFYWGCGSPAPKAARI